MPSSITNIDLNHKDRPRYSIVGARLIVQFLLSNFRRQRSPLPLPLSFPDCRFRLSLPLSSHLSFFPFFHFLRRFSIGDDLSIHLFRAVYGATCVPFPADENHERRARIIEHLIIGRTIVGVFQLPFESSIVRRLDVGRYAHVCDAIIFAKFAEMRLSFASIARLSSRKMRLSTAWRGGALLPCSPFPPRQRNENFVVPSCLSPLTLLFFFLSLSHLSR